MGRPVGAHPGNLATRHSSRLQAHLSPALAAIVLAGGLLRFGTLTGRGLWPDETATIVAIRPDLGEMLHRVAENERSPPLYYILAWIWSRVFGNGEAGLRSLSALVGTLTIVVTYAIGAKLGSRRVGLVAAALAAANPLLVWYSQDARTYALLTLLVSLSFLLFLYAADNDRTRLLAGWAIVSALAIAAHYFALFPVVCEAAWLLSRRRSVRKQVIAVGGVVAVAAALLPLALHQRSTHPFNAGVEETALWRRVAEAVSWFLAGPQPPVPWTSTALCGALALVGGWLLWRRTSHQERTRLWVASAMVAGSLGIPLLLAVVGLDYWAPRNVIFALIPLAVLAAAGCSATRLGIVAATGLCAVGIVIDVATADTPKFDREDWRGAAKAVGRPEAGRAFVLTPDNGAETFLRYHRCGERVAGGTVRLHEIDLIGLPPKEHTFGSIPHPPRPASVPSPVPGFNETSRVEAAYFTLIRLAAVAGPRTVRLATLPDHSIDGRSASLVLDGTCLAPGSD